MQISIKNQILENKFSTVDMLTKEIWKNKEDKIYVNSVDPESYNKQIEFSIFDSIIQMVVPKKTVMWVNMYDIKQMNIIKKFAKNSYPIHFKSKQRHDISPQPRITMIGFSNDAFFSKRRCIVKPQLRLKRINLFADFSKKHNDLLKQVKEKKLYKYLGWRWRNDKLWIWDII